MIDVDLDGEPGSASSEVPADHLPIPFFYGMELNTKPELRQIPLDAPIPGTEHLRLPDWCDRTAFTTFVRRWTRKGFVPITRLEAGGYRSSLDIQKGLRRALAFQTILLQSEDRNGFPLT